MKTRYVHRLSRNKLRPGAVYYKFAYNDYLSSPINSTVCKNGLDVRVDDPNYVYDYANSRKIECIFTVISVPSRRDSLQASTVLVNDYRSDVCRMVIVVANIGGKSVVTAIIP